MKKFYVAAAATLAMGYSNAQVLLNEDFQENDFSHIQITYPSVSTSDTSWYNYDEDGLPDGSGTTRNDEWFLTYAFAVADSLTTTGDTNVVITSNSWFSSPGQAKNWLITKSLDLPAGTGTLKYKSASFQTPYYLDGYQVLLSNSDNDLGSFSTVLAEAGEYTAGDATAGAADDYSGYTFAPAGAWTQGINGGVIVPAEVEDSGDHARYTGVLTEKTVDLSAYAGQTIFIAFLHNSFDDNLISLDDIRVDWVTGVNENESLLSKITAYPNPTTDFITLDYTMSAASPVILTVTDIYGRMVYTESMGIVAAGANKKGIDVSGYAKGTYNVQLRTDRGMKSLSFIKK